MFLSDAVLLGFASAAALCDLGTGKIPNALTGCGLCCGAIHMLFAAQGPPLLRLWSFLGGAAVPLLLLGWLFILRMIGAGDIKLLCMAGSFLGPRRAASCVLFSLLFGGAVSAYLVWRRGNLFSRLSRFGSYISDLVRTGQRRPYRNTADTGGEFCFSVPVLLALICILGGGF